MPSETTGSMVQRAGQLAITFVQQLSNPEIVDRAEASARAVEAALRS